MGNSNKATSARVTSNYSGYYNGSHTGSGDVSFDGVSTINVRTKLSILVHAEGVSADRAVVVSVRAHSQSAWVELATGTAVDGVMTKICGEIVRGSEVKININGDAKVAVALKS